MSKEERYLQEVLERLMERGKAARDASRSDQASAEGREEFLAGVSQGYYEVVSFMLGQLDAFDISRSSVGVPDIMSVEADLL